MNKSLRPYRSPTKHKKSDLLTAKKGFQSIYGTKSASGTLLYWEIAGLRISLDSGTDLVSATAQNSRPMYSQFYATRYGKRTYLSDYAPGT